MINEIEMDDITPKLPLSLPAFKEKNRIIFSILMGILIAYIITDLFIAKTLYDSFTIMAVYLQSESSAFLDWFFKITSFLVTEHAITIFALVTFICLPNKITTIKLYLFFNFAANIVSILKMIYAEPRPFFITSLKIEGKGCETDYGRPSWHACIGLLFLLLVYKYGNKRKFYMRKYAISHQMLSNVIESKNFAEGIGNTLSLYFDIHFSEKIRFIGFKVLFSIFILFILTVGLSRIYLGVHSLNQVLLGFAYGLLFYFLIVYIFDKWLYNYLESLAMKSQFFTMKNELIKAILVYIIQMGLAFIIGLLDFGKFIPQKEGIDNINKVCNGESLLFANENLAEIVASSSLIFGILLGLILSKGKYNPDDGEENFQRSTYFFIFIRIFILLLLLSPAKILLLLNEEFNTNFGLSLIFQAVLFTSVGIIILDIVPGAYNKLKLELVGDFLIIVDEDERKLEQFPPFRGFAASPGLPATNIKIPFA